MLTEAEVDTLAHSIVKEGLEFVKEQQPQLFEIVTSRSGEKGVEFGVRAKTGTGSFYCVYYPLTAIKRLIVECDGLFDQFEIKLSHKLTGEMSTPKLGEYAAEHAKDGVRLMARCAGLALIGSFFPRFTELVNNEYDDHQMLARGVLGQFIEHLEDDEYVHDSPSDMSKDVEAAAQRVADRKRELLREKLSALPNIISQRKTGRTRKSDLEREQERHEFIRQIKDAYKSLRDSKGKPPKKVWVARELRTGGLNPRTGNDSSAQALNVKLGRLDIDYDEVAAEAEEELNNNSG
ncbi:MAG: hypothetical protein ACR2HX_09420 [Pyrinomonadaceae bacterium]